VYKNGTIRSNILGCSSYEEAKYRTVIQACDLDKDLSILEDGDTTLVGSKGGALSGGQKQRLVCRICMTLTALTKRNRL
jgi:ABC-type bacteriocin/lantibiotic exporter with double-glycine peptidase domain